METSNKNVLKNTTNIAVIMNSIDSMKSDIQEIKGSVKDIHNALEVNYVTRREFKQHSKDYDERYKWLRNLVMGALGTSIVILITTLINIVRSLM